MLEQRGFRRRAAYRSAVTPVRGADRGCRMIGRLSDTFGIRCNEIPSSLAAYPHVLLARVNREDDRWISTHDSGSTDRLDPHEKREASATPLLDADPHSDYAKISSGPEIATSNNVLIGRITSLDRVAFVPTSAPPDLQTRPELDRSVSDRIATGLRRIASAVVRAVLGLLDKATSISAIGPPPRDGGRDDDAGRSR